MSDPSALPGSRLYTLADARCEFAGYFLEGQALIRDLALLHDLRGAGFAYFRDVVLSIEPLIALLKHGEQLGFYVDAREPQFRLKIETSYHGTIRGALVPEGFAEFPQALSGVVRVLKLFPRNRPPYESVLEIDGLSLSGMVNRVLRESYQINSTVIVSAQSDQSLMLHQLPPLPGKDEYEYSPEALALRHRQIRSDLDGILARGLHAPEEIAAAFGEIGFRLLAGREIRLTCACSRERVIRGLQLACGPAYEELFDPGQDALETVCEYCKTAYSIRRSDLEHAVSPLN
jgi:molecular chaperone Hsp33